MVWMSPCESFIYRRTHTQTHIHTCTHTRRDKLSGAGESKETDWDSDRTKQEQDPVSLSSTGRTTQLGCILRQKAENRR